jgi:peptide/nickel transport system ATP-binding protein
MSALLDVRGLEVRYGAAQAVQRLDLTVNAGETVALVGESGCGKSTSALALIGLLPRSAHTAGQALFEGRDLLAIDAEELRQLRGAAVSMVFQDSATSLNPVMTVGRQIEETLRLHAGLKGAAARARAVELLELVEIPRAAQRVDHFPHQFSGGQRQRVAIAMAVACRPRLLIADEPTTALDVAIQGRILELLDRMKRELGMGLLLITHDLGLVAQWADRVAIMQAGLKVEDGTVDRIVSAPAHPYTKRLLAAVLGIDEERHYDNSRLSGPVSAPGDAVVPFPVPRETRADAPGDVLLELAGVEAAYHQDGRIVPAVRGVDLTIRKGETLGLVGESGCGKSTLSRLILRLQPVTAGHIRFDGEDITRLGERELRPVRPRLQMMFQDPHAALNPRRRVIDIMHRTLIVGGVGNAIERNRRILEIADRVGLAANSLERFPHEFSGGQKQRICIARALLPRPSLVICDEPASSLDLPIRAQVLDLLADLKAEYGLSYLFISHDLSVVRYMADRVAVMNAGRIVETGDYRQIWHDPRDAYTRQLITAIPHYGLRRQADAAQTALSGKGTAPAIAASVGGAATQSLVLDRRS